MRALSAGEKLQDSHVGPPTLVTTSSLTFAEKDDLRRKMPRTL